MIPKIVSGAVYFLHFLQLILSCDVKFRITETGKVSTYRVFPYSGPGGYIRLLGILAISKFLQDFDGIAVQITGPWFRYQWHTYKRQNETHTFHFVNKLFTCHGAYRVWCHRKKPAESRYEESDVWSVKVPEDVELTYKLKNGKRISATESGSSYDESESLMFGRLITGVLRYLIGAGGDQMQKQDLNFAT